MRKLIGSGGLLIDTSDPLYRENTRSARYGEGSWYPRKQYAGDQFFRNYKSPNHKVWITLGGEYFTWSITIGSFAIHWDRNPGEAYEVFDHERD